MSGSRNKADIVRNLAEGVVAREGFELVDVEFVVERGRNVLRLYIDTVPPGTKERGVQVDDCALVSRVVGDLLDVEEALDDRYTLEVSSPGLFRPLVKPEHYDRALSERVRVKTFEKVDGRKVFIGILQSREGSTLTIDVDGTPFTVDLAQVAKANLEPLL
jgi:ribosome maturation factor RimP